MIEIYSEVTSENWQKYINHVIGIEKKLCEFDKIIMDNHL